MRTAALLLLTVLASTSPLLAVPAPPAPPVSPNCRPIEGVAPLLAPGRGLLLGEMHGTVESPAFLADVVCLALQVGRPVTVALEIPFQEEARVAAYLGSSGSAADRTALLAGAFWQDPYQDGRRSEAMLALLESLRQLRQLRHAGTAGTAGRAALTVVLLDSMPLAAARDRAMAELLSAAVGQRPKDLFLALTGNYHNRLAPGAPWDAHYEPMGLLLSRLRPDLPLTALNVATTGGTAWVCLSASKDSCHVHPARATTETKEGGVSLHAAMDKDGYTGIYRIGPMTASPPAVPVK